MNQEFNLRYNEIQPEINANDNTPLEQSECVTYYETEGHSRNVCFVLEKGDRVFLNYAYLISGEQGRFAGEIRLNFTTYFITIQGNNLHHLFDAFSRFSVLKVGVCNNRYKSLNRDDSLLISNINLEKIIQ